MKPNFKPLLLAACLAASGGAGAAFDNAQFSAVASLGAWSSNRVLDDREGILAPMLSADASVNLTDQLSVRAGGLVYNFAQDEGGSTRSILREAFLQWTGEETQIRAGWQVVAWGRADRINPTDNISARDYTSPQSVDEAQRMGAAMLSVSHDFGNPGRLTLLGKEVKQSRMPNDEAEKNLPMRPDAEQYEYAAKFDHSGDGFDWSLSYFKGLEKPRSLQLMRLADQRIVGVNRGYAELEVFGADAATTLSGWGLRGEIAHMDFPETDFKVNDGRISHWYGITGVETNLPANATIGMQYFFRYFDEDPLLDGVTPAESAVRRKLRIANNQFHQYQDGLTLRIAQRLWNDSVDYEIVGVVNFRDSDYAIRPRINWRYSDSIKLSAGADIYRGKDESFFGSLRKNNVQFAEISYIY
ncbi:hypothetical protein [Jeongeupia naejangsanensis]|uniref:Alginate export domain-containing protein n=1 Tax=Jeongeupia naejangsanensis TaxID=613195 RepID=A0ABS2BQJ4_9NEIS|nr:hypothetical protein [Jeongeupia naejangsanensis]MBM3117034.1 hypothetical protein [Jeongeupia naejangsanensis]